MPIVDGQYVTETVSDYYEELTTTADNKFGKRNYVEGSVLDVLFETDAEVTISNQEESLQEVYQQTSLVTATGASLTRKAREVGAIRQDAVKATGVVQFSRDTQPSSDVVIPSGTVVTTESSNPTRFETTESTTITTTETSTKANVRALTGGADGNLGPDTLTVLPSPPSGVEDVTNPNPTGDPDYTNTNGETLQTGRNEEDDDNLRQRALSNPSFGGNGTAEAVELTLLNQPDLISVTVNTNQTANTVDGLDPYSTEVVVQGGDITDIAEYLYGSMSLTTFLRLQGGVNGTKATTSYMIPTIQESVTVPITRPDELSIETTVDIVVTDAYEGDDAVTDAIISYVGGTDSGGARVIGLGLGENVIIAQLENVVEDVRGVVAVTNSTHDSDGDGTDDTTTDSDGVTVISVGDSEVPTVNGSAVTINTTQR